MCGISAVIRLRGQHDGDVDLLANMHRRQLHRGPDGEGAFFIDTDLNGRRLDTIPLVGETRPRAVRSMLAVRRLRVSDPRAQADQPIVSRDGKICVALNGAIYNYRELSVELKGIGIQFQTGSDAEVVLQAYRQWGTECFKRFDGMWGIAILDLGRAELIISRDRVGIKPLYYAIDGECLLLASEPQAIAFTQAGGPKPEPSRTFEFLSGYPARSPSLSYFKDVHPVPAGTFSVISLRGDAQPSARFLRVLEPVGFLPRQERFCHLVQ